MRLNEPQGRYKIGGEETTLGPIANGTGYIHLFPLTSLNVFSSILLFKYEGIIVSL